MKVKFLLLLLVPLMVLIVMNCDRNYTLDLDSPTTPLVDRTVYPKDLNTNVMVIYVNETYSNTTPPTISGPWLCDWCVDPKPNIGEVSGRRGDAAEGKNYIRYKTIDNGGGNFNYIGFYVNLVTPIALPKFANGSLIIWLRNANSTNVLSVATWGGTAVTVASRGFVSDGTWQRLKIPISAFAGANLNNPGNALVVITGSTKPNIYFDVDSVYYTNN